MRFLFMAAIAMLAVGPCSTPTSSAPASFAGQSPSAVATKVHGGCGSTQAYKGGVPAWLDAAGAHNNPKFLPYVIANPPIAAAFLWVDPLRVGHPVDPTNKILVVVREPRGGSDLRIVGHPVGAMTPVVEVFQSAGSSPGEIYPSIVDVPKPGCWQFDLWWAGHAAAVELSYT